VPRALLVAALAALPGCLTVYSKTEVVRCDEARRPVQFDGPQTADEFHCALKDRGTTVGKTHIGVPFITLYSKRQKLSEAAAWNEAVLHCDTDQNGMITRDEVAAFSKAVD
jgi:PHP family Zn ribbon phosphoesterase